MMSELDRCKKKSFKIHFRRDFGWKVRVKILLKFKIEQCFLMRFKFKNLLYFSRLKSLFFTQSLSKQIFAAVRASNKTEILSKLIKKFPALTL